MRGGGRHRTVLGKWNNSKSHHWDSETSLRPPGWQLRLTSVGLLLPLFRGLSGLSVGRSPVSGPGTSSGAVPMSQPEDPWGGTWAGASPPPTEQAAFPRAQGARPLFQTLPPIL